MHSAGVPSSPMNLHLSMYSSSSVQLSWSPPNVSSHCVGNYTVTLSNSNVISSSTNSMILNVPSDHESSTEYCATVAAVDFADQSGPSKEICFTLDG